MIVWQITRRLETIAQKTPAGWLGTELPLEKDQSVKDGTLGLESAYST